MYSFSSDMGTNWTDAAIVTGCSNVYISQYQSNDYSGPGPTPVVASYFRGGSEGTPSFLLVYAADDGLHYRYANTYSAGWSIPSNDIVPGSSGSSSQIWFPTLASYNSQDLRANLMYGIRYGNPNQIYSQIFNDDYPDGSWTSRVAVDWLGVYNRFPSLSVDYANSTLAIWCGQTSGLYTIRFRQGFSDGTWSSWEKEWSLSGYDLFYPAITYYNKGGSYPYGIDILWHSSANQIYQKKYYGLGDIWVPSDPSIQLLASTGKFPNISHERQNTTVPVQMWADQSTSPVYSILYNSTNLPKAELLANSEIRRAAEIVDPDNNSHLRIEISQPIIELNSGETKTIEFKEYDYTDNYSLSLSNLFDYLQTETLNIPSDAESISFNLGISSFQPDTLEDGSLRKIEETSFNDISFEMLAIDNSDNNIVMNSESKSLSSSSGIYNNQQKFIFNSEKLKEKEIYLLPKVNLEGSFKEENLLMGLVNVSIEGSSSVEKDSSEIIAVNSLPLDYSLSQNYPNPFNPSTNIQFSIPQQSFVTLKVYDILGSEIATLVNEQKAAGKYEVNFDASSLSSGVYIYKIQAGSFISSKKMILIK